jgi:hypothetical protein
LNEFQFLPCTVGTSRVVPAFGFLELLLKVRHSRPILTPCFLIEDFAGISSIDDFGWSLRPRAQVEHVKLPTRL